VARRWARNNLDKIALSNTHYKFTRHLDWAGGDVNEILVPRWMSRS